MNEFDLELFDDTTPEPFKIDTLELADWAVRKISRAESEITRLELLADSMKKSIDERLKTLTAPHVRTITNMTILLEPWANLEIAKQGGKKKSYSLISGRVGFRQNPQSIEIIDEAKAVADVEQKKIPNGIKKTVSKTAVKEYIKQTGVTPEGVEVKTGEVNFYVDAKPGLEEIIDDREWDGGKYGDAD